MAGLTPLGCEKMTGSGLLGETFTMTINDNDNDDAQEQQEQGRSEPNHNNHPSFHTSRHVTVFEEYRKYPSSLTTRTRTRFKKGLS
jgi:hypothetical protein